MLTPLIAAIMIPTPTRVVAASLFKNGFALVSRRLAVTGTSTTVAEIPQAALGTFWITTTGDLKIGELVTTIEESTEKFTPGSFEEFLRLNLGREVSIQTMNMGEQKGKLLNVTPETILLEKPEGTFMINRGEIRSVLVGKEGITTGSRTKQQRVMRFKTSGSGEIVMFGLERGLTWAPAYAFDMVNEKQLTLTAKATVLNDLDALNNTDLRFVTGFPNVPWATAQEPLLSGQSVDQFTNFLASVGIPDAAFRGRRDTLGGQGGAMSNAQGGFGGGFEVNTGSGEQSEDLFFYKRGGVTLKKGDRAYYVLFEAKSDYSHLYTVDLEDGVQDNVRYVGTKPGPIDVWHSLKLKNTSGQPLTTAPGTVFKDGQILGQDTVMYTPTGAEFMVKMSKALDIRVEAQEEEIKRERVHLQTPRGNVYDLVTLKGTISLRSFKGESVDLRIQKVLTGEVAESTGTPKVIKLAKGLIEINPRSQLTWTPSLEAGKTMEITYTYKVYVNS